MDRERLPLRTSHCLEGLPEDVVGGEAGGAGNQQSRSRAGNEGAVDLPMQDRHSGRLGGAVRDHLEGARIVELELTGDRVSHLRRSDDPHGQVVWLGLMVRRDVRGHEGEGDRKHDGYDDQKAAVLWREGCPPSR